MQGLSAPVLLAFVFYLQTLTLGSELLVAGSGSEGQTSAMQ